MTRPITAPATSRRIPAMLDAAFGDWVAEAAPDEALLAAEPDLEPEELADGLTEPVALADPLILELEADVEEPPPSPESEYPIFVQLAPDATW